MAGEIIVFDATGSNLDGTDPGTALEVGSADDCRLREFNAPAPSQTVQYAESVDTEGGIPSSRKHENRIIALKILCMTAAALRTLQAKVGKIAREGGTLKWILPGAETVIFDLLAADTFEPLIDKLHYVRSGAFCEVQILLSAKPYGRGTEQDLGDNTETTLPLLIFTDTGVKGDMPGLGRLVIDNDDASNPQQALIWGVQSRYYSSASTAALFYQAESCGAFTGAIATGPAGASGGGSNNTWFYGSLPVAGTGVTGLIYIGASATAQTHVGTFRVFVRARTPSAGIVSLQANWQPGIGRSWISNGYVPLVTSSGIARPNVWLLVDLGEISIPPARVGSQGWLGYIDAISTVLNDDIYLDWIMLVPVDEGSGQSYTSQTATAITASGTAHIRHDGAFNAVAGGYVSTLEGYEGDYFLVPPAGLEARTLRAIVKLSRGDGGSGTDVAWAFADDGTDDLSARLFVTPRYLVVPEP